ncbi:MAG TPA: tyrosine-type recombinase/integrase [Ignavibacteriaceae bacterium]|nr:tyrosine-type recombinase/integrase [Ignavibacteriaceae bacterium]
MATIRVDKGKLFIDYRVNGKRQREYLGLDDTRENRKTAEIRKKEIEYKLATGISKEQIKRLESNNKLFQRGFEEFLQTKRNLKQSTIEHYKNAFEKLIKYSGNIRIKEFTKEKIEQILLCAQEELIGDKEKGKKISGNTIASYFIKLRVVFGYFVELGYCDKNPIPRLNMKPKKIVVMSDKEIETVLEKLKTTDKEYLKETSREHYRVIAMLLMTGLRISECLALSFDDIDFRDNLLRVKNEKTDRIDYLPLYPELKEFIMAEWKSREGNLFHYKSRHSLKFFDRYLKKEGLQNYSFHTLRKTFISKLINSGMSVYDVMTLARHKNIKTTLNHYTAAELQRMGKQISEQTNLGSLLGRKSEKGLKLLKIG